MRLDTKDLALLAVGGAFLAVVLYIAYDRTDNTGQPRFASPGGAVTAGLFGVIDALDTGDHYFHPAYCVPGQTQIFTQHKYPDLVGGNLSSIVHQGMDRLSKPAPQDNDWFIRPPGEVMF